MAKAGSKEGEGSFVPLAGRLSYKGNPRTVIGHFSEGSEGKRQACLCIRQLASGSATGAI